MLPTLTRKQKNFVQGYLETGNATLATRRSYGACNDQTARAIGSENLRKPLIRQTIQQALEAAGLTTEHIASKISELVNAKKIITVATKGKITMAKEELDTHAVKAGLEFTLKIKQKDLDSSINTQDKNTDFSTLSDKELEMLVYEEQLRIIET